jgi:hypothetical protein
VLPEKLQLGITGMSVLKRVIAITIIGLLAASGAYRGLQYFNAAPPGRSKSMNLAEYPDEWEWISNDASPNPYRRPKCKPPELASVFQRKMDPNAPVIVKATVTGIARSNVANMPVDQKVVSGRYAYARIDQVISGNLEGKTTLFIVGVGTDQQCAPIISVGESGALYGTVELSKQNDAVWSDKRPEIARFTPSLQKLEGSHDQLGQ